MKAIFRRTTDVVCRNVGAESILVPIRQNVGNLDSVYTLSQVAARVWTLLDGTRNVEAVVDVICDEYEVERSVAAADVTSLITDLAESALISQVNEP